MDIEEMKKNWLELNERLEKREKVNREAIRKLLTDKAVSGYDKMRSQEKTGVAFGVLFTLLFPTLYFYGMIHHLFSFILIEVFVILCLVYNYMCLLALPQYKKNQTSVIDIMKSTLRYQKLYAFVLPMMILGICVGLALFFFLEGKGFDSDNLHKVIFFSGITLGICGATIAYKKTMSKVKEVNNDIEELRKFEQE